MLYEKKYYGNGSGNFDDADFVLQPNQWVNLQNARVGSTDNGVIGTVESVGSNVLLSPIEPSVTNVMIGAAEDPANFRFIYFLKDLHGPYDKIVAYDTRSNTFYNVLFSAQVVGGLNFSKYSYIHSARAINGMLYWTDYLNQPRRLNINAGINLNHPGTFPDVEPYADPLNAEVITIIRKPPVYPITLNKKFDAAIEGNRIKDNAFRFTYFYTYRDGERSTIAPHSLIANYNYADDTYNEIDLEIPIEEKPDQDVEIVTVVVIYVETNNAFVVRTWNKENPGEAAEIAAHVAGTTSLSYDFANDIVGEAIDAAHLAKPYDTVPLLSETLENGTNRIFLGRNLLGYDTPITNGLTAEIVSQGSAIQGNWWGIRIDYGELDPFMGCVAGLTVTWYFAYFPIAIDGSHPAGFYDLTADPLFYTDGSTLPGTINISNYTWIGTNPSGDVYTYIGNYDGGKIPFIICSKAFLDATAADPVETAGGGVSTNVNVLKSDSPYRLGVIFYDQYLRQCGVVSGPLIRTPDRDYDDPLLNYGIQWSLNIGAQPGEIPDWAYYYSIVSTNSLRTSYFLQSRAGDIVYATKDSSGNYVFTSTTYADTNVGIALKLDLLVGNGMGYSYQAGDIVKIYLDGVATIYSLGVTDQSGEWLVAELADLGSLASATALFEIYTPRPQTAAELYYEVGVFYPILDPGTLARRYHTTSGFLPGDVYLLTRGTSPSDYVTENMSPSNTYWQRWFTNAGRVQIKESIGQQFKQTSIKWSNTFIPGTITNGLSTFDALDEKILPGELGPLRKLQITSKVNNELGAVMLGICEQETASMYLGEQQLVGSAANAFIAQASDVIGTVNVLKGTYGTLNPESVVEFKGNVYWVDVQNGKVVQYSLNGLYPISNYKMTRFWKQFCDTIGSMSAQDIEALGSRPFIFSAVDPHHWELLITVPTTLAAPPMGYLPDPPYTSYVYPFDIWDGQGKTLVYKINAEPNYWIGSYSQTPEGWVTLENKLYSFKYGQLYLHNSTDSYCNFYDVQYASRVMGVCNQEPERIKVYDNACLEANMLPSLTYFMCLSPYMQVSNLRDFDYDIKEGVYYSQIYRNVLTPTATGLQPNGLVTGEKLRTYAFRFMLEFAVTTFPVELRFVNFGYQLSLGHSIPTK
jgi:hypothetical protein